MNSIPWESNRFSGKCLRTCEKYFINFHPILGGGILMAIIIPRLLGGSEVFLENKLKPREQSDCQAALRRPSEGLRSQRSETKDSRLLTGASFSLSCSPIHREDGQGTEKKEQWKNRANQSCHRPRDIAAHQWTLETLNSLPIFSNQVTADKILRQRLLLGHVEQWVSRAEWLLHPWLPDRHRAAHPVSHTSAQHRWAWGWNAHFLIQNLTADSRGVRSTSVWHGNTLEFFRSMVSCYPIHVSYRGGNALCVSLHLEGILHSRIPKAQTSCSRAKQSEGGSYPEAKQSLPQRKAAKSLNKDRLLRDSEYLWSKFITTTATICLQLFHGVLRLS